MPNIARKQILANLQASLAAMPAADPEATFKAALARAGLKDKPFFTPEETSLVGRAIMEQAQADMARALESVDAELAAQAASPDDD